ncbi:amidase [Saccharopolyspora subtropica]|uniref:Amidase n=1 Tax=Saccharopolyspora thermophila TaxID=89367 RepID=A0A917NAZ6_9PSEU|nr:amidase [Saccharopolyspora subtropica]GGI84089.1 amidase [Saccharopolyspora subtropica]
MGTLSSARADALAEATIAELQTAMATGQLSAVELVRYHLDRIDQLNLRGPQLRAVLETNPQALEIAELRDAERRRGHLRGALHGIPVLVKDNIETADLIHTSNGTAALLGARPERDATVIARLRAAGAIVLGKTNKSGWISGSAGWSARGGQGRNPHQLDRSPHGSSSGSAAAVAAGLSVVALGTETIGSILGPAGVNGVVGLKPTVGLTSRAGMIPGVRSLDTIGPLCRTVADAATVLGVLTGIDERDPATAAGRHRSDYRDCLGAESLAGTRIGVPRESFFGYDDHADAVAEQAIRVLAAAGATIVDPADVPSVSRLLSDEGLMMAQLQEVKHHLDAYLAATPGEHPRSIAELIAYNRAHAEVEMPYFGQETLELVDSLSGDLTDPDYVSAVQRMRRLSREDGIDAVLREHRLDALVAPTGGPAWKIDLVHGDPPARGSALIPGLAGYPAISVPAGEVRGLPVGVTFLAGAWSEPVLLRIAHAFEQAHPAWFPPRFQPPSVG